MSQEEIKVVGLSRRSWLAAWGALGAHAIVLGCKSKLPRGGALSKNEKSGRDGAKGKSSTAWPREGWSEVTPFLALDEQAKLHIVVARSEMGQGVRTTMAMLVAEELDLPWEQVRVIQAAGDARYGNQNTDGSTSARTQYKVLRRMGAAARMMLMAAAAKRWGVSAEQVSTKEGKIFDKSGQRSFTYAELMKDAAGLDVPKKPKLREPKDFRLISTAVKSVDTPAIVSGQSRYGIDVKLPELRIVSVERCPYRGGSLAKLDKTKALAVPGVEQVIRLKAVPAPVHGPEAVAVVAKNTWSAIQGRRALKCEWKPGPYGKIDTQGVESKLKQNMDAAGEVVRSSGDVAAQLAKADKSKKLERDYEVGYLPHQPMEPLACTAWFRDGKLEVWAPTQAPQRARRELAKALDLSEDAIQVHVTLLGGGFGRKGQPDFVVEAALVAKAAKVPVKVLWSREDEIQHGFYRPAARQRLSAVLDPQGKIQAWQHRCSYGSIMSTFNPKRLAPAGWETAQGMTTMPLDIPHVEMSIVPFDSPLRIGWVRSVHHLFHAQAVSCFVDELAQLAQQDPIAFYLKHLPKKKRIEIVTADSKRTQKVDTGRLRAVIEELQRRSAFDPKKNMGFAAHASFRSAAAAAMQVEVKEGKLRVNKVWMVVDCGRVIHPHHARGQVEGAVIFGLSAAFYGKVDLHEGSVQQSNFHDLPVCRIDASPEMDIAFIGQELDPTGVGEPPVPPIAPALLNAVFAATGKRFYDLPLSKHFRV